MASTECSTEEEATSLRRRRLQAPPCSWSRLTYLSTSPSASPLTCGPTPGVRPSHSACLTTGKSFQAAPFQMAPSPTRCILQDIHILTLYILEKRTNSPMLKILCMQADKCVDQGSLFYVNSGENSFRERFIEKKGKKNRQMSVLGR